jgi:hypothetical protein
VTAGVPARAMLEALMDTLGISGIEPWVTERWHHAGFECGIAAGGLGGYNGYVRVPADHPWFGVATSDHPAHEFTPSGVTYSELDGWVGFDTLHFMDSWALDELTPRHAETVRILREHMTKAAPELALDYPTWVSTRPTWTLARLRKAVETLAEGAAAAAHATADDQAKGLDDDGS